MNELTLNLKRSLVKININCMLIRLNLNDTGKWDEIYKMINNRSFN